MGKLTLFGILGIAIETLAIFSFIGVIKTPLLVAGKQIVIIFFLFTIVAFLVLSVKVFSLKKLVLLSVFLTISAICIYQTLGFSLFPGLVKDIVPLSLEHLKITGIIAFLVFCCYMGGILLIIVIRKLLFRDCR